MKKMLNALFLALAPVLVQAQVSGNVNYEAERKSSKGNSNYNSNNASQLANTPLPSSFSYAGENTYILKVNALSNQKPDAMVAIFALTQAGETAEETDRLLQERYKKFVADLQGMGLKSEDIYLDMVSFVPVYEYEVEKKIFSKTTYNEVPKGFELQQNVHIRYTDKNLIARMVTLAAKHEIYDLVKVDYFVNDPEKVHRELRQRTFEYINAEVKQMELLGIKLDTFRRMIAEDERVVVPVERYSSYQAFSSPSVDARRATSGGKGNYNYQRKPNTYYYDKLPYSNFEVVVNPVVHEPVVQFMYSVEMRFVAVSKPQPTPSKEYYWMTPQGTLQKVNTP